MVGQAAGWWTGRHVVVTGASRGIGATVAEHLHRRGARLTVLARNERALKEAADRWQAVAVPLDLADDTALQGIVDRIEGTAGPIDVLINNAALAPVGPFVGCSGPEIAETFAVNAVAPAVLMSQVLPRMLDRGRGSMCCVSSLAGVAAVAGTSVYGASKSGLMALCTALHRELRSTPVDLTMVVLGEVAGTDMMERGRAYPPIGDFARRMSLLHALPSITPSDVAAAVASGIERHRRLVVLPRRAVPMCWARELPSRVNDLLTIGIDGAPRRAR